MGLAACVSPKSSCSEQSSPELRVEPEVEDGVCTHRGLGQDCGDGKQSVGNLIGFAFFQIALLQFDHIFIPDWWASPLLSLLWRSQRMGASTSCTRRAELILKVNTD